VKSTIVVMSTNRGMEKETKASVQTMREAGAIFLQETGSADVAFARCRALSWACDQLREQPDRDVVLMIDDDMEVPLSVAQELADKARELGRATSAVYATLSQKIAAHRWHEAPGLWLVGLGCVAIPRQLLLELEERSESFESSSGKYYTAFTWCGPRQGSWVAEDFQLCINLGGVHLCPLAVGHIKKGSLWPDEETLALLAKGESLNG
jgi:hypothetical protein